MTRLDDLHASIADWYVQRGGKLDVLDSSAVVLTEIKTGSWTVFIGPDSWGEEAYEFQTKSLEVAILIDPSTCENCRLGCWCHDRFSQRYLRWFSTVAWSAVGLKVV